MPSMPAGAQIADLIAGMAEGRLLPYLGPGMAALHGEASGVPYRTEVLAQALTAKIAVPHKLRGRLTSSAQFIENFKHRRTLIAAMNGVFSRPVAPSPLQCWLAALRTPLIVDMWYDDAMVNALAQRSDWGQVQGLSQAEHFGTWYGWYGAEGSLVPDPPVQGWTTLLYKPIGGHAPAANYVVSDSDFVEVLTEIDIQTPIPREVQQLRVGRGFVFLGCRFNDQLPRSFARQIMKRSGGPHWAVIAEEPTRMEARFLAEQGIGRIPMPLEAFAAELLAYA